MKTVLVTGGAGFIGSHLCERLLASGWKVVNLDNFNSFYPASIKRRNISAALIDPQYTLMEGDILDPELLSHLFSAYRFDAVVHLAALAGVRSSLDCPQDYVDIDIKGTVNLLELCKSSGVAKFVFASSSSIYGDASTPFRENTLPAFQASPYAAAKRSAELFCATYSSLYNISCCCLRFFTVYGPRQRPEMAIHLFTRLIDEGREITLFGDGSSSRDYTYIDDIIDGIEAALWTDYSFEAINLGNSNTVKLDSLVDLIGRKLGKSVKKKYMPGQPGDVQHTCADITKAGKLLRYYPRIPIEDGLERFVHWYKNKQS